VDASLSANFGRWRIESHPWNPAFHLPAELPRPCRPDCRAAMGSKTPFADIRMRYACCCYRGCGGTPSATSRWRSCDR